MPADKGNEVGQGECLKYWPIDITSADKMYDPDYPVLYMQTQ